MSALAEKWAAESVERPGMAKETFVRNHIFGSSCVDEVAEFLKDEEDLHGKLFESTSIRAWTFITKPDPEREGWTLSKTDMSAPHIVCRIQIEVVTDGRGHILGQQRENEDRWSDCA